MTIHLDSYRFSITYHCAISSADAEEKDLWGHIIEVIGNGLFRGVSMSEFPKPDSSVHELTSIAEAWALSASFHEWNKGANDTEISAVEKTIGRRLPAVLRAIYKMSDGFYLLEGNLIIEPLQPSDEESFGIVNYSDKLREWKWPIPDELIVFGGNGSDELFGIWLPKGSTEERPRPIIEVGEIFEDNSFAVVGTKLCNFLKAWTAYYIILLLRDNDSETTKKALDALNVPEAFHEGLEDDELMRELFKWADPSLPDYLPDPYDRGLTAQQLRQTYGANHITE